MKKVEYIVVLLQQSIYLVSIVNTVLQFTVDFNIQKTILSMCIHNTNTYIHTKCSLPVMT